MRFNHLIFLLFYMVVSSSYAGVDESSKDLDNVKNQIKTIDKEIKENKAKKADISKELKAQEQKISKTRKEIHSINKKSKQNLAKLKKLNDDQAKLIEDINNKKSYLSNFLQDFHKRGESSYLQSIIKGESPSNIMRDQKLQSYYTSAQIDLIKDLESKNNKLIETKQIIKKTISKIENLKKDKGKVKEQLEDEKKQKKQLLVIVDNEIKNKEQIKQKLIEDEKKLKSIVDELLKKAAKEAKDQIRLKDTKKNKIK